MNPAFDSLIAGLPASFERLLACAPVTGGATPDFGGRDGRKVQGVYLFSEAGSPLYVGRTSRMLARYKNHWMATRTEREAAFAFKLARVAVGFHKATYKKGEGSRSWLAAHEPFILAFTAAKARIQGMEFRWVEESDPNAQCLLEVYAALALKTPFNDFDNH